MYYGRVIYPKRGYRAGDKRRAVAVTSLAGNILKRNYDNIMHNISLLVIRLYFVGKKYSDDFSSYNSDRAIRYNIS